MKNAIIALLLVITAGLSYNSYLTYNTLRNHEEVLRAYSKAFSVVDQNFEGAYQFIKEREDMTVNREHALQDSLEERIGSLEHNVEGLQYIFGKAKKK